MSRIHPDLPELQPVPEALRSIAYMRAMNRAVRAPLTWLMGAAVFALCAGVGGTQGGARFGRAGTVLGTAAGAAVAILCFFKLILPWRARVVLPSVLDPAQLRALDHVRRADERLQRIADAYDRQERDGVAKTPKTRGPERLPKRFALRTHDFDRPRVSSRCVGYGVDGSVGIARRYS